MTAKTFFYPVLIKETFLDLFGHVNNAMYLTLFEEARWELISGNGYGVEKIRATSLGPVILEANLRYIKELRLRDEIVIETCFQTYLKKIGTLSQKMVRNGEVCCTADFSFGLFDLNERKLVPPTSDWLRAVGYEG